MRRDHFLAGEAATARETLRGSRNGRPAPVRTEEFEVFFNCSFDGVLVLGPRGNVTRANSAACDLFRMSQVHLRGMRRARDLLAPGDWPRVRGFIDAFRINNKATATLTALRSDGARIEVQVTAARFTHDDGGRGLVVLRKLDEDDNERVRCHAGEQMRSRAANVEAVNAELTNFARSMSRDLRGSLDVIEGFSVALERALRNPSAEDSLRYVQRIRAAGVQIQAHVQSFMSLVQLAGATVADADVNLSALAGEVITQLQALGDGTRVLNAQVMEGLFARGDPRLLRMALENLLGNAWKFSSTRAVSEIEFFSYVAADGLRVYCVRDNGVGFDLSYGGKLFGPLQRVHSRNEFPGAGIGLANVRRIIERHGGRVWAESAEGQGAAFYFTLTAPPGQENPRDSRAPALCPLSEYCS